MFHLTPPLVTPEQLVTANRYRIRAPFAPAYHHALAHQWGHLVSASGLAAAARKFKRHGGPAWTSERSLKAFDVREVLLAFDAFRFHPTLWSTRPVGAR